MKERPILFSAPMVRAILDGRKTQTRRLVYTNGYVPAPGAVERLIQKGEMNESRKWGKAGDRLWVRETWGIQAGIRACATDTPNRWNGQFWEPVTHRAGTENYAWGMYGPPKWKPSIHMPRTGCRIVLEVISVRVERLHDISEEDAKAEGVEMKRYTPRTWIKQPDCYRDSFIDLWKSINGADSWGTNPWVWVVELKRIQP